MSLFTKAKTAFQNNSALQNVLLGAQSGATNAYLNKTPGGNQLQQQVVTQQANSHALIILPILGLTAYGLYKAFTMKSFKRR